MITPNISIPVRYSYGKLKGIFHIWLTTGGKMWGWSAMGGTGEEKSKELAVESARVFIVSKLQKETE